MKRYFLGILAVIFIISLTACGRDSNNTGQTATQSNSAASQNSSEQSASNTQTSSDTGTLIAYFTWADNTVVENPDNVDTDATTSASLLAPGNAAIIAEWIQQEIGGDLFSIKVNDPYSSNYDECLERAADEKAENARPALSTRVEDMEKYDTVFIGYPNWWYSCPMALLSFIEEYDLSGKKIVLFCTHGTGGLANSVEDITASLPENCTVEENVLGIYRPEVSQSQQSVLEWLNEIGYTSQNKEDNSEISIQYIC